MPKSTKRLGDFFQGVFKGVENSILERIASGNRIEEDHITSTFFTLLEECINSLRPEKLTITARQFPGRGPNSDESIVGADGALILDVKLHNVEFRKIILLQAKIFLNGKAKFNELAVEQKHKMLYFTPDSFFMVYQKTGIKFVSAFLVGAGDRLSQLPLKRASEFLRDYFDCFIGDHLLVFPPDFWRRPWRFWPVWEELRPFLKGDEKTPIAKINLLIEVRSKENNEK